MNRSLHTLCVTLILCTLTACGGGGSGNINAGGACSDLNLRIFGGDQCNSDRSPVVALVALDELANPVGVCSATMVTVNDALTSAHCFFLGQAPGGVYVYADSKFHEITAARVHPKYDGQTASPYDIGMITIDSVLDIGPVPLILSRPLVAGDKVTAFGYGRNEEYIGAPRASDFRATRLVVDAVGLNFVGGVFDSDHRICNGDSGGPATMNVGGVTGVVGVNSFADSACQSISGFVNVQNPEIYEFILGYAGDVGVR